jgi:hypothetical protein
MAQSSGPAAVWLIGTFVLVFGVGLLSGVLLQGCESRQAHTVVAPPAR